MVCGGMLSFSSPRTSAARCTIHGMAYYVCQLGCVMSVRCRVHPSSRALCADMQAAHCSGANKSGASASPMPCMTQTLPARCRLHNRGLGNALVPVWLQHRQRACHV